MRDLLSNKCRESTRAAFLQRYIGIGQQDDLVQIQSKDLSFMKYREIDLVNALCGYRQLWMYAWRNFPTLVTIISRKDSGKQKFPVKCLNEQCWRRMAQLAGKLGYEYFELAALQKQNSDAQMVMELLRQARPIEYYNLFNEILQSFVLSILQILESIKERNFVGISLQTSYQGSDLDIEYRCERLYESAHDVTRSIFFYQDVYQSRASGYSHFMIHREIFQVFFGSEILIDLTREGSVNSLEEKKMDIGEEQDQNSANDSDAFMKNESSIMHSEAQESRLFVNEDQGQSAHDVSHTNNETSFLKTRSAMQVVKELQVAQISASANQFSQIIRSSFKMSTMQIIDVSQLEQSEEILNSDHFIVDHLDREKTDVLWKAYTDHCSAKSIFFVIAATGNWRAFDYSELKTFKENIQSYAANFARHHIFLVYHLYARKYWNIVIEKILAWVRNDKKKRDRVILVYERSTSNVDLQKINLVEFFQSWTTKERLELISKSILSKRRQDEFVDEEINRIDNVNEIMISLKGKKKQKVTVEDYFKRQPILLSSEGTIIQSTSESDQVSKFQKGLISNKTLTMQKPSALDGMILDENPWIGKTTIADDMPKSNRDQIFYHIEEEL